MKTYIVKDDDGTKFWYLDGKRHREDGPAVEYADGSRYWYLSDKLHRTDGPAIEHTNGTKLWYLDDKEYTEVEWFNQTQKVKAPCVGKVVEIDGVKYKLDFV